MAPSKSGWEMALQNQLASLSHTQRTLVSESTTPEDIVQLLQNVKNRGKSGKVNKLLETLHKVMAPLRDFESVVDVLVQAHPETACLIWGPLKLMLIMLEKRNEGFEKLALKLTALVDALPRYNLYCDQFRDNEMLQKALGNLYVSYLEFCFRAARYFEAGTLATFIKTVSGSFDRQFADILAAIDRNREEIEKTVSAVSLVYVQDVKSVTTQLRDTSLAYFEKTEREKTLKWLSPADMEPEQISFKKLYAPKTCEWLLSDPNYFAWTEGSVRDDSPRLLWLRGNVGCGKTFLSGYCIEQLSNSESIILNYFFNGKQEQGVNRTALSFIRTLIYQLLADETFKDDTAFVHLHELRAASGFDVVRSDEKLWNIALDMMKRHTYPKIRLVVDALDEAQLSERTRILDLISQLLSIAPGLSVLVTSRPEEDLSDWFDAAQSDSETRLATICLSETTMNVDIKAYVSWRVTKSRKLSNISIAEEVQNTVVSRADGMFLFARLLLDDLEQESTVAALRKRMNSFPDSLSHYYANILDKMSQGSSSTRELARNILMWTITSMEPMKMPTLVVALQAQARAQTKSADEFGSRDTMDDGELLDPVRQIKSICFPLIEVTDEGTVQVVHCSVTDFILAQGTYQSKARPPGMVLTAEQTNHWIAVSCLLFLSNNPIKGGYYIDMSNFQLEGSPDYRDLLAEGFPSFAEYALSYWLEHLSQSQTFFPAQLKASRAFFDASMDTFSDYFKAKATRDYHFHSFFSRIKIDDMPACAQVAAYFGNIAWLEHLLDQYNVNSLLSQNALSTVHIAAARGFASMLKFQQDLGLSLDKVDADGLAPIHYASRNGHASAVRTLVVLGCDVNSFDNHGRSALIHACSRRVNSVVTELLRLDADVSLVSKAGYTAISEASKACDLDTFIDLIRSPGPHDLRKVLLLASAYGNTDIVKILLTESSVNIDQTDQNIWSPLHWAARNGHEAVVDCLIMAGAQIDLEDSFGRTPLNRAVRIGNHAISQRLINAGAKIMNTDQSGYTLVHHAASEGHNEVLNLLIAAGGDVNVGGRTKNAQYRDPYGPFDEDLINPFQYRKRPRSRRRKNNDIKSPSPISDATPLHLAAAGGHLDVLLALLKCGALKDAIDDHGQTALHIATKLGNEAIVNQLIESGANLKVWDDYGDFPLTIATKNHDVAIVFRLASTAAPDELAERKHSPVVSALRAAAAHNFVDLFPLLLGSVLDGPDISSQIDISTFRSAFENGHMAVANALIDLGYSLDRPSSLGQKCTALAYSIDGQQLNMIEYLISMKINPDDFALSYWVSSGSGNRSLCNSKVTTALDSAVLCGNLKIIEMLRRRQEKPPDPRKNEIKFSWPFTITINALTEHLLLAASRRGDLSGVDRLSSTTPAEHDTKIEPGNIEVSADKFLEAIISGDIEIVKRSIKTGFDVNLPQGQYDIPFLIKAIQLKRSIIVEQLVQAGANPNIKYNSRSAMYYASESKIPTMMFTLLSAGAAVDDAKLSMLDSELLKTFLDAGANPNQLDGYNETPLISACRRDDDECDRLISILLAAGADVNLHHEGRNSPIHCAAQHSDPHAVRILAEAAAVIDVTGYQGLTPLHVSIRNDISGATDTFRELVQLGASLGSMGHYQLSALHLASAYGNQELIKEILSHGININIRDSSNRTPLIWAVMGPSSHEGGGPYLPSLASRYLCIDQKLRSSSFTSDSDQEQLSKNAVEELLANGSDINAVDFLQRTALHWAARHGRDDIAALLISRGASIGAVDQAQRTPLHVAVACGVVECVRVLLNAGADPNVVDNAQWHRQPRHVCHALRELKDNMHRERFSQAMPIHHAIQNPDTEHLNAITRLLLDAGADPLACNYDGQTALHIAVIEKNVNAVKQLLKDNDRWQNFLDAKDRHGKTAYEYALEPENKVVKDLFDRVSMSRRRGYRGGIPHNPFQY